MQPPIEFELRGEVLPQAYTPLLRRLQDIGFTVIREERRTMLMSFGMIGRIKEDDSGPSIETDIRCRVTNNEAEIVVKSGDVHSADRRELSTPVSIDMLRIALRIVGALNTFQKVGSRHTTVLTLNNTTVALVRSKSGLAYIELERLTDDAHLENDRHILDTIAHQLELKLWQERQQFMEFCARLTRIDDWIFDGTDKAIERFFTEAQEVGAIAVPATR